jgi:hypothetical protein
MKLNRILLGGLMALAVSFGPAIPSANAIPVATEVLLLADVSGSLDAADFALQRDGYVAAFQSALVKNAIAGNGPIAVSLVYWSEGQQVAVPWTLISNAAESDAFAAAISAVLRPGGIGIGTHMADAMNFGTPLFDNNGFESQRQVMDISGDGADSENGEALVDLDVQAARDNALANGVDQINALWIDDRDFFGDDPADAINALQYGINNVLGGTSPFQGIAQDFDEFQSAIVEKIGREVIPPPPGVPDGGATAALLGIGLLSFGFVRRFRS